MDKKGLASIKEELHLKPKFDIFCKPYCILTWSLLRIQTRLLSIFFFFFAKCFTNQNGQVLGNVLRRNCSSNENLAFFKIVLNFKFSKNLKTVVKSSIAVWSILSRKLKSCINSSSCWVDIQNNILHDMINKSRTTWPSEILISILTFLSDLLQDSRF